jgi:hypothetical protein
MNLVFHPKRRLYIEDVQEKKMPRLFGPRREDLGG